MRIAVCLHGKIGGLGGKNGIGGGEDIVLSLGYYNFVKNVLYPNKDCQIDFFLHCWDADFEENLKRIYDPKGILVESPKKYSIPSFIKGDSSEEPNRRNNHYSRWDSYRKVIELKKSYEDKHNFVYDGVLSTRYDMAWDFDFSFKELDPEKIWHSEVYIYKTKDEKTVFANEYGLDENKIKDLKRVSWSHPFNDHIWDAWFYASSKISNDISNLFDRIPLLMKKTTKRISHHHLLINQIKDIGYGKSTRTYKDYCEAMPARWFYEKLHVFHDDSLNYNSMYKK